MWEVVKVGLMKEGCYQLKMKVLLTVLPAIMDRFIKDLVALGCISGYTSLNRDGGRCRSTNNCRMILCKISSKYGVGERSLDC